MTLWRFLAAGAALLAALGAGHGARAASAPDAPSRLDRLIEASGIGYTVRQIRPALLTGIETTEQEIPGNVRAALLEAATQSFQTATMLETVRKHLATALTARQLDDTLAWLDGELGRRITVMENEAADPKVVERLVAYARELEKKPPPKKRVELMRELNRVTGSSELNITMMEATILATALGVNAAQPVQQQVPHDVLRQQVKAMLPRLRKESDALVGMSLLYTYRTLTDQEFETYLNFLKTQSGEAYSKAALGAYREMMLEAIGRFMQAIPKALEKHKGTVGA